MTRISSYDVYQCPDCKQEHILPNYASISVTVAVDLVVAKGDLRICFGCGTSKPFKQFVNVHTKKKPGVRRTPFFVGIIKKLLGLRSTERGLHPARIYPYLNPSK
jgi:hypothetical protein